MKTLSATHRKSRSKKETESSEEARPLRMLNQLQARNATYVRKMGSAEFSVVTSGGGLITLATLAASASANTCPDFAAAATLYQLYRVRAIVVKVLPFYPCPVYTGAAILTTPSQIYVTPFYSGNSVASIQGHIDATGTRISSGYRADQFSVDFRGDPEAHFWTPVTAAVPANESFGLTIVGTNVTSTASINVWRCVCYYIVEFKMMS